MNKKLDILDILNIYKYIAQNKWIKLCILFKLYPELHSILNNGYYTISYTIATRELIKTIDDVKYSYTEFYYDLFDIKKKRNRFFKYLCDKHGNELFHDFNSNTLFYTVKKNDFDNSMQKILKQNIPNLQIVREFDPFL